jgi:acyl-CoA synthetase (AMP-forming)/AMP-acid ligase II
MIIFIVTGSLPYPSIPIIVLDQKHISVEHQISTSSNVDQQPKENTPARHTTDQMESCDVNDESVDVPKSRSARDEKVSGGGATQKSPKYDISIDHATAKTCNINNSVPVVVREHDPGRGTTCIAQPLDNLIHVIFTSGTTGTPKGKRPGKYILYTR